MARGRGVEYDQGGRGLRRIVGQGVRHRDHGEQLVDPGRGQLDEVLDHGAVEGGIEPRAPAQGVEELVHGVAVALAGSGQGPGRVQLARHEARRRARHPALLVAQAHAEHVGQRVRGIGGQEQRPTRPAVAGRRQGHRGRGRGLPHPALAAEDDEPARGRHQRGEPLRRGRGARRPAARAEGRPHGPLPRPGKDPGADGALQRRPHAPERVQAARLPLARVHDAQRQRREGAARRGHDRRLRAPPPPAERARSGRRRGEAVDDDLGHLDAGRAQGAERVPALLQGEHLRQEHPPERRPRGVA